MIPNTTSTKVRWIYKPWSRFYIAVLFLLPIPILLVWFSFTYRLPLINRATQEMNQPFMLSTEIERAKKAWTGKDAETLRHRWENAKAKVPGNYKVLSQLIEKLALLASTRGLEMNYSLGTIKPAIDESVGFSIIPLNVKLGGKVNASGYAGNVDLSVFVKFLKEVVETRYGLYLKGLSVVGTGGGIKLMKVDFDVWVGFLGKNETS